MSVRRVLAAVFAAASMAIVVFMSAGLGGHAAYRVDAIFDSAKGLVPGQVVKIAGARVGTVTRVRLVEGPAARVEMAVDRRYAPFRADARCSILPEGLISENYVECEPGQDSTALTSTSSQAPTVQRTNTRVPVSVQDLLDVFAAPTNERLRVLVSELGIATAGRGTDLNAVLRRTNPSLMQARRLLTVVGQQTAAVTDAVEQTDRILTAVSKDRRTVRGFVRGAAAAFEALAPSHVAVSKAVAGLPRTLAVSENGLEQLERLTVEATPLLDDVRAAATPLDQVTRSLPGFSIRGLRAISAARPALRTARRTVPRALPLVTALDRLTTVARPVVPQLRDLLVSLRDTGGIEGVLNLGYTLAAMSSGYDQVSHVAGFYLGVAPTCIVANISGSRLPAGCDHGYQAAGHGTVPVNAPGVGPQEQWSTVMDGATANASMRRSSDVVRNRRDMTALLDYLLK